MWSGWKWLTRIVSICFGSMPAAAMFACNWPVVGAPLLAKPASIEDEA